MEEVKEEVKKDVMKEMKLEVPVDGECNYKGYIHDNGMKIILITSPNFRTCGAAMNVRVGHIHAPSDIPGLPHLLEHVIGREMLVLDGNTKFGNILDQHGGLCNADTYSDHTIYYYRTNNRMLQSSLSCFKQMIFTPNFDELSIASEIELLDSEYIIYSKDCLHWHSEFTYAKWDVSKLKGKCTPGNKITLQTRLKDRGINIKDELQMFHDKYYTPNLMSLCVFAEGDMNQLKKLVEDIFSDTPDRKIFLSPTRFLPQGIDKYCTKWFIIPRNHDKFLWILLPLPFIYDHCGCQPEQYMIRVLEDHGNCSLLSYLKMKRWATMIKCKNIYNWRSHTYFSVQFELTRSGLDHINDIIYFLFEYTHMLRITHPKEEIYEDYGVTLSTCRSAGANYIEEVFNIIAGSMNDLSSAVRKQFYDTGFHGDHIHDVIETTLRPEYIIACVVAREYEEEGNQVTPWTQVKFRVKPLPEGLIQKCSKAKNIVFQYPHKNSFQCNVVPTSPRNLKHNVRSVTPVIISQSIMLRGWYKAMRGLRFDMFFQFTSKEAYCNAEGCNLNGIFVLLIQDRISTILYSAGLVRVTCTLQGNKYGIGLHIGNDEYRDEILEQLLTKIVEAMRNTYITKDIFKILLERYVRDLKNLLDQRPDGQAHHWLEVLLTRHMWSCEELLHNIGRLNVKKMQQFIKSFLNNMFVEYLIRGDILIEKAKEVTKILERTFSGYALQERDNFVPAEDIILNRGCHFLYERRNIFHECSCTMVYYQLGERLTDKFSHLGYLLHLISIMIYGHCTNELRSKACLGYIVEANVIYMNNTCGLLISITGHVYDTKYVEDQIDKFMKSMLDKIRCMSDDVFYNYKKQSLYMPFNYTIQMQKNFSTTDPDWKQIVSQNCFNSQLNEEELDVSNSTFSQVCNLFKELIDPKTRRKLSVHIKSEISSPETRIEPARKQRSLRERFWETFFSWGQRNVNVPEKIENIASFKERFPSNVAINIPSCCIS